NPFLVPWDVREDWPHEGANIRLACIGRLNPLDKGQDLVLRVLGREKWRQRPLFVSFYGSGDKRAGLEGMARHLSLSSVAFEGFSKDPSSIWDRHHGLLLGSRCEGLPLVLVEAMLSGRVPLVTDAGGNGELIEDGVTGFLAAEPSADALDEALERAWQRRAEWRVIGRNAASAVRAKIPREPGRVMAATLKRVAAMEETAPIQDGSATARDQEHHSGRVRAAR
ncbi:MAG TPA: glycosyltransferase, partial [Thermoanaerobaculia bacterium]|nr:glycosyltransferase [Thermoanaerobaculia bacterium]